jgi:hypothetical protein
MEIPFGHRAKILKRIKEFKVHRTKISNSESENFGNQKNYEHLELHEIGCGGGVDTSIDNIKTSELQAQTILENNINDEEEQSRLFRKAVEEFRNGKKIEDKIPQSENNKDKKITVIREVDEEVDEVIKRI